MPTIKPGRINKDGIYTESWTDPIYRTVYHMVLSPGEIKEAKEFIFKKAKLEIEDDAAAFTLRVEPVTGGIHIFFVFSHNPSLGIIAHECVHAANMTFKYHGIKLDVENDEHQAYYTESLVTRCTNSFARFYSLEENAKFKTKAKRPR